jgi:hypothetical protein
MAIADKQFKHPRRGALVLVTLEPGVTWILIIIYLLFSVWMLASPGSLAHC